MIRKSFALLLLLAAGCAAESKEPVKPLPPSGPRNGLFISPMGEPFRASAGGGDLISRWFDGADADHDGNITLAEMQRDAARFFATLDTNHDGELTPPELVRYEQQVAPEIQLGAQMPRGTPGRGRSRRGGESANPGSNEGQTASERKAQLRLPEGASRYGLLDLPEPVAAADADFNRAVSAQEFADAAAERFQQLDKDHDGKLTRAEVQPVPPPEPKKGR